MMTYPMLLIFEFLEDAIKILIYFWRKILQKDTGKGGKTKNPNMANQSFPVLIIQAQTYY